MATIKDVARLAGVSVATVSRVINNSPKASEASRQSVGAAMEALNYHPNANARALAQQSTQTVGLVVGDVSDPFFGSMVKAVEQVAYEVAAAVGSSAEQTLVIDLADVTGVTQVAARLMHDLLATTRVAGGKVDMIDPSGVLMPQ